MGEPRGQSSLKTIQSHQDSSKAPLSCVKAERSSQEQWQRHTVSPGKPGVRLTSDSQPIIHPAFSGLGFPSCERGNIYDAIHGGMPPPNLRRLSEMS